MGGIDSGSAEYERANRLYWQSKLSVNQIAEDLGLSKGALYDLIEPRASDYACPECDGGLTYPNRTAHEKGRLTCSNCGSRFEDLDPRLKPVVAGNGAGASEATKPTGKKSRYRAPTAPATQSPAPPSQLPPQRILIGTAVLGVGVGLLLGRILGRR